MAETSFPYAGGQGVTDAAYEQLMSKVTGDGRIDLDVAGNSLTVPAIYADSTGRQFKVRANSAFIVRGFRWEAGADGIVRSLDANTSGNPRLDLVVLRLDRSNFTVRVQVLKGTPAAVPTLPAVTQQTGSTGRYEIPLASIRVAHNAGSNLPSIASGDVTAYENWLGAAQLIGHSFARPAVKPGGIWTEYDTNRSFVGLSNRWHLFAEDTPSYQFTANGSWDPARFYVYATRRNGWVMVQGIAYRKNGLADAAPGTDIPICTLPEAYRPDLGQYGDGSQSGNLPIRVFASNTDGAITLFDHEVLKAGQFVHFGPLTWPIK